MISCTEFIPAYSELFSFLEENCGSEEVNAFWKYLFEPTGDGIPLINFVKREGIRGCFQYWSGTLNEEAADFSMYLNEKAGWFLLEMHHCPSKGRLLQLKDEVGIVPYRRYCLHCDYYRSAIEKVGLRYIYNFSGIDHASCNLLIYDPKIFAGRIVVDENTEIMNRQAAQNEYFHPDFHSSMNMGIHYLGEKHGFAAVEQYLVRYTKSIYHPVVKAIKDHGLSALQEMIQDTYEKEKAAEVLTTELIGNQLSVRICECPAVRHLKASGRTVSPWYRYTTEVVMRTLAEFAGCSFVMEAYEENTGAAQYRFTI